ncbi:uncharacterized protein TNCV_3809031 [Trichonephila clavipes]|nr:uncharacterized protein TNCV_3809031 [Trichonephila clavipes]
MRMQIKRYGTNLSMAQRRRPTRIPLLTARHKALRFAWTHQHRHLTVDDRKHVALSDESRFQLNRAVRRVRVWRQPHESMDLTCQQGTVQAGGGSVMVWGMRTGCDMGPPIRLELTLIGDLYLSIPFMPIVHSDGVRNFSRTMLHSTHPEMLQRSSRSTLLNLDTFAGHQNPQT